MRISDWSSDVCSSDLLLVTAMVCDGFTRLSRSARMPMMFPRGLADWRIGDSEQATPGHRPVQAASVADFQAPKPRRRRRPPVEAIVNHLRPPIPATCADAASGGETGKAAGRVRGCQ